MSVPRDPYAQLAQGLTRPAPAPYGGSDAEIVMVFSDGRYLKSYDPDKQDPNNPAVTGDVVVTPKVEDAKRFPDMISAATEWTRQSTTVPLRPDGQPNKPLTAFTVSFDRVAPLKKGAP